jgi:DNA-directed RNA polymerase subunit F
LLSSIEQDREFQIDVTITNLQSDALLDFLEKIVKLHYLGSLTAAVEDLMRRAVVDEEFVTAHITGILPEKGLRLDQ